jgi:hypothetical protein
MTPEARKAWKTPEGASLLEAMFKGGPLTREQQVTLEWIKLIDPPKIKPISPKPR